MKPDDVKPSIYVGFNKESNRKGPGFEVGDHVRICKCKNIFAVGYVRNWSEGFAIKKVENTIP